MEFARRGRSTAPADAVDDGRRPPPPHDGDAGPEQGDLAALARRKALLWELRKERISQELILRELAHAERTMAARDVGHGRASMPPSPWEEAPLRAPRPSEQLSWWRGSPSEVSAPLYPHVERSPSPTPQPRQTVDAKQQGSGRSSSARAPSLHADVEQCRPLSSKEPAAEGALVPTAANAVAKSKEVTLTPQRHEAAGQERQAGAGDSHADAVQLFDESANRSSEPSSKPAEFITGDWMDERVQPPRQCMPAAQDSPTFDGQVRLEFNEPTPKMASSGVKRKLTAETSPVKKQKPPGKWSCSPCQANTTGARNLALRSRQRTAELSAKPAPESSHGAHQKRPLPLPRWGCSICEARCATKADLEKHRGSWLHRRKAQSLRRNGGKNMVDSSESHEEERLRERIVPQYAWKRHNPPPNWRSCSICEVECTSESDLLDHLRGRRHREKTEALRASNGTMNKRSLYYCEDSSVQCNSERRRRETLLGRH